MVNTTVKSSFSVTVSVMDLDTNYRENYASQSEPMHLQENYLKPSMKEVIPFSHGFLQDFPHIDQFHANGSTSNSVFGDQTPNFDPFDNFSSECSAADFAIYECKTFLQKNDSGGHAHVMDNFQYEHCYSLNLPLRNQVDMMVANQSYFPFNPQETKPSNSVVADEVSCISPADYFKRIGLNKNKRSSPTNKRTRKVRKKSNIVKGQWTVDEDRLLIQLVEQYGVRKWSHIAQMLAGRVGKQCRERWHNHLRPDIKKDTWTEEEDKILIHAHVEIGNKWAEIAKRLPGRTENSIKNHWNATKRRQYSKRKCRSKYPRGSLLQEYIKSLNLDQNPPIDYRKRYSANANANAVRNSISTSKASAAAQPQNADKICPKDHLVPNYDFNEVPEFCFDENLFQEGYSIDSLLDDMPCTPTMDEKDSAEKMQFVAASVEGKHSDQGGMQCARVVNLDEHHFETEMSQEMMASVVGIEVKKEMDLVEMMSQVNEIVDA